MNVVTIYGNPKEGGLVHGCLDVISDHLAERGAQVERLRLKDLEILDCTGCFTCLRTGTCVLADSMNDICEKIRRTDCLVLGCSVRNGTFTALYKRFLERITYPICFTGDLYDKYTLSVSAVGIMTGKKETRKVLGLASSGARHTGHLFFKAGFPTKLSADDVRDRLHRAADRLGKCFEAKWRPGLLFYMARGLDRRLMRKFMFTKDPEQFAHVIECYKRRGWWK